MSVAILLFAFPCALTATLDPRVRRAEWWRVLVAAAGAAVAPSALGAIVLTLADPHAPPEPWLLPALAGSLAVGLLVGGAAVAVRRVDLGSGRSSR